MPTFLVVCYSPGQAVYTSPSTLCRYQAPGTRRVESKLALGKQEKLSIFKALSLEKDMHWAKYKVSVSFTTDSWEVRVQYSSWKTEQKCNIISMIKKLCFCFTLVPESIWVCLVGHKEADLHAATLDKNGHEDSIQQGFAPWQNRYLNTDVGIWKC